MLRTLSVALGLIFFVISNPLKSEEMNEKTRMAMTNFLYELAECTIYFSIIGEGKGNSGSTIINKNYKKLGEEIGLATLRISKAIGMKKEALMAIMQRYSKEMGDQIDNDGINISILVEKHGVFCKGLVENPEKRILYWLNRN